MRASLVLTAAALASCNASNSGTTAPDAPADSAPAPDAPPTMCAPTGGDPIAPPVVATGPLQLNDVSILFPLSATYLCASSAGSNGPLLPAALFDALPLAQMPSGISMYQELRAVALRIDPCFASLDPDPQGSGCAAQIRLVFEEVTLSDTNAPTAFDSGVHALYSLTRAELLTLAQSIAAFRAANSTGRLGALAPSPIIAEQGEAGAYAQGIRSLVLQYANPANLVRVTAMTSDNDRACWTFDGDQDATTDTFAPLAIPTLAGSATQQRFITGAGGATAFVPGTTSADDLMPLANGFVPAAQAGSALDALVRIDNPTDESANTIDCVSCHTATPLSLEIAGPIYGFDEEASGSAYRADGTYVLASELTPTLPPAVLPTDQLHAFSYINGDPEISQRVVNESAAVVVYLNHALGL